MKITNVESYQILKLPPKKYGSMRGMYFSSKNSRKVYYESNVEKNVFQLLEWLDHVIQYKEQPIVIHYEFEGKKRTYRPDILVDLEPHAVGRLIHAKIPKIESTSILVEVKTEEDLILKKDELEVKFNAARMYCKKVGFQFVVISNNINGEELNNIRMLNQFFDRNLDEQKLEEIFTLIDNGFDSADLIVSQQKAPAEKMMFQNQVLIGLSKKRLGVDMEVPITNKSKLTVLG